ncbi:hypothetical protein TYRP_022585 [Tyrophagus putrescentiae]|nr:hypothetical protein TYRP_022585 [Tyrophagus putrescentiae]
MALPVAVVTPPLTTTLACATFPALTRPVWRHFRLNKGKTKLPVVPPPPKQTNTAQHARLPGRGGAGVCDEERLNCSRHSNATLTAVAPTTINWHTVTNIERENPPSLVYDHNLMFSSTETTAATKMTRSGLKFIPLAQPTTTATSAL